MDYLIRLKYDDYSTIRALVRSQRLKFMKSKPEILEDLSALGMLIKHDMRLPDFCIAQ
jgi:hypothetical protein